MFLLFLACNGPPDDDDVPDVVDEDPLPDCEAAGTIGLPFPHHFGSDGLLLADVEDGSYRVEIGAWGSFGGGHGGHLEGDFKNNYFVVIEPSGSVQELVGHPWNPGDEDGVCDAGEMCGISPEDAFVDPFWWTVTQPDTVLLEVLHEARPPEDFEHYIAETDFWGVTLGLCKDVRMSFGHLGELSPALLGLLEERGFDPDQAGATQFHDDPIPLDEGLRLARPQIIGHHATGDLVVAYAQAEWDLFLPGDGQRVPCAYGLMDPTLLDPLQAAMDRALVDAPLHSRFYWDAFDGRYTLPTIAQGVLCEVDSLEYDRYDRLTAEDNASWVHDHGSFKEVMNFFPVHRDTAVFAAHPSRFDPGTDYLFNRFVFSGGGQLSTTDGWSGHVLAGQAVSLDDDSAVLLLDRYGELVYQGMRYHLGDSELVVRWGAVSTTREGVVLPDPIPSEQGCDGDSLCYTHSPDDFWN